MHSLLSLFILLSSFVASAQTEYLPVMVTNAQTKLASVRNVKLLNAKVVTQIDRYGHYENRSVAVTVGLEALASLCEVFSNVALTQAQTSLESTLNPSDFYYTVPTTRKAGCATGSYGKPQLLSFELVYDVDQREASEVGKPWNAPNWIGNGQVRHLSFYKEMLGGQNIWSLYRLDMSDLANIHLDFKKDYSYIQGEVR